ncbi:MAG: cupredoxin domain-containing protein [Gammaproteobacteria bacterium]|nr:cupredoxin domain-containing protein [Gammaproteobacteria bacterium]
MMVNIIGILLIALIVWWFWIKQPRSVKVASNEVEIIVDNGVYSPSNIELKLGQSVKIIFLRKDPSPCAEKVIFEELGVSLELPVNKAVEVTINPEKSGSYVFNCQMKMYTGHLKVSA